MNAPATDDRHWSWWAVLGDDETFTINEPTREAVIAKALEEHGAGATITIVEATQDGPFDSAIFDAEDDGLFQQLAERFGEVNSNRFGEDGFDGFPGLEPERQLATMLNDTFRLWLDQHGREISVYAFTGKRNSEELILTAPAILSPEAVEALRAEPMSTEQMIGRTDLLATAALRQRVSDELERLGFVKRKVQQFGGTRTLWYPAPAAAEAQS